MVTHDSHAQPGHLHDVHSVVCSQGHVAVDIALFGPKTCVFVMQEPGVNLQPPLSKKNKALSDPLDKRHKVACQGVPAM